MSKSTNSIGKSGELQAITHLSQLGFKILETNWRFKHEEIDIIAEYQSFIVFVEVKTRSNITYGKPEDFVTKKKQKHIIHAANEYLIANKINKEARFDVVSVTNKNDGPKIEHIPDAFYASL